MKRYTLIIATLFVAGAVMSQDLTSKKGELYLPEAGDYAIGIDAAPFLNYVGNLIGGADGNVAPTFGPHPLVQGAGPIGHSIYGKMMIDATSAYRANVRLGIQSITTKTIVADLATAGETVEDKTKVGVTGVTIGLAKEFRRGNTRLQGVYGAGAQITYNSMKTTFEYGNTLENMGSQLVEQKTGSTFGLIVAGFAGVEYFFAPKMSVGGEYGFGIAFNSTGNGSTTTDVFDAESVEVETGGGSAFGLDTGVIGQSNLMMTFYF